MGVQISGIIPKTEIELEDLSGKKIAIDAYNIIFQFLSIIRQRDTGEPLRDSKGRITSHLSGIFYRTIRLVEAGIKPIFIFDGPPPDLKRRVVNGRKEARKEALKKWGEAVEKGRKEDIMVYAQASADVTDEMIDESKKLLDGMGIPWVQAPSEGEAQACVLVEKGDAYAVGSQDYDAVTFGSPRLVRNLSITGKRKLPRQEAWIEIKPELIILEKVLSELGITREQLVIVGMLTGTDYNPGGIKGVGAKTALKLIKEHKTLDKVLEQVEWKFDTDPNKIYDFFLNPPVSEKYEIEWKEPDQDKLFELMSEKHDFSRERIKKGIDRLIEARRSGVQAKLEDWFKK